MDVSDTPGDGSRLAPERNGPPGQKPHLTRGHGLLEPLLARLRARQANRLIPSGLRSGRILDIGCGSYPYFLSHTSFQEKFAIDQLPPGAAPADVRWHVINLNTTPVLPFEDRFFNAITMLAVVEHLDPGSLISLFQEVHRTLAPGGRTVVTTPSARADKLLRWMARVRLVSPEEINEHVFAYHLPQLGWYLGRAGFPMDKVRFGYFEMGLNMWATAER